MRAMILAAGRGQRMRPLTDEVPKPLLQVKGQPLIVYHIKALARAGIRELVINLGHLGSQIEEALGDGKTWGVHIQYSYEDPVLETGGGITKALPLLGGSPFIAMSSDLFTDFPFDRLPENPKGLVHLVLTDNTSEHPKGDYALIGDRVEKTGGPLFNYAGIGVYRPELFLDCKIEKFPIYLLYEKAIRERQITGEYYQGPWVNVGTPQQLALLNNSN